jgi:uncharacterized membrane protein (UPF0136 family)
LPEPDDVQEFDEPFRPLRPESRPKLIAAIVFGPVMWLVALLVAARLGDRTDAMELALLITAVSIVIAAVGLGMRRLGRRREEHRYADRA